MKRFRFHGLGLMIGALLALLLAAPNAPSAGASSGPTISSVAFTGPANDPTITISGSGFGSAPASTGVAYPGFVGDDYGTALHLLDSSANPNTWSAGYDDPSQGLHDYIGLRNLSYSDAQISYQLGTTYTAYYYGANIYRLNQGDRFTVFVNGAACSGAVDYSGTAIPCSDLALRPTVTPNPVTLNGSATASAGATDTLSTITSQGCDAVDTSSVGSHTVACVATDAAGNTVTASASYQVVYGVCMLYDPTKAHKAGSTVPIKLQLCDAGGNNVSSAGLTVHATTLTKVDSSASATLDDAGSANPDYDFRYDATLGAAGGYIYNLSTKGLTTGTYRLHFTADGQSATTYVVSFDVK